MLSERTRYKLLESYLLNTYGSGPIQSSNDFDIDWKPLAVGFFVSMILIVLTCLTV